jgi:hypothetical protein
MFLICFVIGHRFYTCHPMEDGSCWRRCEICRRPEWVTLPVLISGLVETIFRRK